MKHECPNGHPAVMRNDPDSTGFIAMCDRCGWQAAFVVAREEGDWRQEDNHQLQTAQRDEQQRRQLAAGSQPAERERTSRRSD